ncbi:DUF6716 putative glycosyltransferase [Microbacterium album]|uniref:Uncharacterized protein n=1 Tax=Microbacterium album TaxID=2053191 RepID=A0A917ICR9_9MICO|nr:DUF6716 putative glycosyltransferase [Microbacterium album]GGH39235.1 hypothetical protein GCM10010921_10340 [Microbacterium album]
MRIIGVAESDSYLKWGAALLGRAPDDWDRRLMIVEGALTVTAAQERACVHGTPFEGSALPRVAYKDLVERITAERPDAVLVAAHGPLARVLIETVARVQPRPVILSGLPGISIPVTWLALERRAQADLMIVHSKREVREFRALSVARGWDHRLALASLPFADRERPHRGTDLVFAAQSVVPRTEPDRMRVARLLVRAAQAHPHRRVVLKLRGTAGEPQTHRDDLPYPALLERLAPLPPNLAVSTVSMARALDTAEGLVTVSSTAAIEAIARGVPVIALDVFGVSDELINPVFTGSGLFGDERAVVDRAFRTPRPEWLDDNYLHDPADDDWAPQLEELVRRRRAGELPPRAPLPRVGGPLRAAWHRKRVLGRHDRSLAGVVALAIGLPLRRAVHFVNSIRAPRSAS